MRELKSQTKTRFSIQNPDTAYDIRSLLISKNRDKIIDKIATEFESFFTRELLKNSFKIQAMENYGYFYHELIFDILSKTSSFGVREYLKEAIMLQIEAMQNGFIRTKSSIGKF